MLLLSDELAGLFLNMSRYSGGQDNEFWLEAWNGSAYTSNAWGGHRSVSTIYWLESSADCSLTSLLDRSKGISTACMPGSFFPGPPSRPIGH